MDAQVSCTSSGSRLGDETHPQPGEPPGNLEDILKEFTVIEKLEMRGVPGGGISDSGTRDVLMSAAKQCREHGLPLDHPAVIDHALKTERMEAGGHCVGADDVVPITEGGALLLYTSAAGPIRHEPIDFDRDWLRARMLFAFRPGGTRHRVADQLAGLFSHKQARSFVRDISDQALVAADALRQHDIEALSEAVNRYVATKTAWSEGRYLDPKAAEVVARLTQAMGPDLLATKPPGAGGAMSLFVFVRTPSVLGSVERWFHSEGWAASPVVVSGGLSWELLDDRTVRISAPHRADLAGAADCGQDPEIGLDGICCSMAIEPISTLTLTFPRPIGRREPGGRGARHPES